MAITAAALQTALGTGLSAKMGVEVLREVGTYGTKQVWYVKGGVTYPGRCKYVETTAANNAATQAATVLAAMNASHAYGV
jgi:hypothetical protein